MRDSLNRNDKDFVPLESEILILESYLKLEQLRFGFNYEINVEPGMNTTEIQIPSLLIQPLIENGIKHGIAGMGEKGRISIHFSGKNKNMYIEIKDNGKGFDTSQPYNGYGLKLTRERIHLLNQTYKEESVDIEIKSENKKGSSLFLSFKNYLKTE